LPDVKALAQAVDAALAELHALPLPTPLAQTHGIAPPATEVKPAVSRKRPHPRVKAPDSKPRPG
jgi:diacylglycerol O-acyltransferase